MGETFADRVLNYPSAIRRAFTSAVELGMGAADIARYMAAYSKNARTQLGSPEKFTMGRTTSFNTRMGKIHFRDNRVDPATLSELVENHYEFSEFGEEGALVDVGACIGMASRVFSFYNPGRRVFCFEPVEESAQVARLNCPHAKVYNCGIGRERGVIEFSLHPVNSMALREDLEGAEKREVSVYALDSFLEEIGSICMLKIDVEGSEADVLLGAKKALAKTARVRMETHSDMLHRECRGILAENGFEIEKECLNGGGIGYIFARKGGVQS